MIYEAYARHWAPQGLGQVPEAELARLAGLGVEYLWLMGVWTTGDAGRRIARETFTSYPPESLDSSPYAIARYEVDARLGGRAGLAEFRRRLAAHGMRLVVDFVPNHTARDHDWVTSHPEIYVREGGELAFGKDPYFPAWSDTAQLDHRLAATRAVLLATLRDIATQADGVRCDMAMLVLSDVFAKTWAHTQPRGARVSTELWADAIDALPRDFVWIGEAYWGLEGRLQRLGFDYTYNKSLYDHLVHGAAADVRAELAAPLDYQTRSLRFVENHDEPRAAASLAEREAAALAIVMTTPGLGFVHDGQIEGRRQHALIQRIVRPDELRDANIAAIHERVLAAARHQARREGSFALLAATSDALVAHRWDHPDGALVVIVNYSGAHVQAQVTLDLHRSEGRTLVLHDVMDDARYERRGGEPLWVDLRPWQAHVFDVTTGR